MGRFLNIREDFEEKRNNLAEVFIKLCCSYFFVDRIYLNNGCKFEKVFVAAVLYKFKLKFLCGQFLSTFFPVWDNLCGEIEDTLTTVHFSYSLNLIMWFLYFICPSLASWCLSGETNDENDSGFYPPSLMMRRMNKGMMKLMKNLIN